MDTKVLAFLASQISVIPIVIVCVIGMVLGLSRRELGMRARLGIIGFGLLVAAQLMSVLSTYQMVFHYGTDDIARHARILAGYGFSRLALEVAGLIVLIVAVFQKRDEPAA